MKELLNEKAEDQQKEKKDNPNAGHRERLKARYRDCGFAGLSEHEKLELLLFFAIPRRDTKPLAKALIKHFGSLSHVFEASIEQLQSVKGITPNAALLISMMLPLWNQYQKVSIERDTVLYADDCGRMLCDYYKGFDKEVVSIVCLNAACKVIKIEKICEGDLSSVVLNCRRIVEVVLKYPKTTGVILVHNHPEGLAVPSREDLETTTEVVRTMRSMGINIVDHFVIARDDYVSMLQSSSFSYIFR